MALTVLDFGRITFGASCTGAAKICLNRAIEHAATRRQFGRPLGGFQLVKEKLALMAADTFAMEKVTYRTYRRVARQSGGRLHARNRHAESICERPVVEDCE